MVRFGLATALRMRMASIITAHAGGVVRRAGAGVGNPCAPPASRSRRLYCCRESRNDGVVAGWLASSVNRASTLTRSLRRNFAQARM